MSELSPAGGSSRGSPSRSLESPLPPVNRDANAALMLGILGFASCGLLSPLAVYFGNRALQQIDAASGLTAGRWNARAGQLMGIVGTMLLVTGILLGLIWLSHTLR